MNETLAQWNGLEGTKAAEQILRCNGSAAWARGVAARRPLTSETEVLDASDAVWRGLTRDDWMEAFATHPRIGERHAAATAASLAWSTKEQATAEAGTESEAELLAQRNREYEALFGRTFLICASGRTKREILEALEARMTRTREEEMMEAAEQQRQITRLRLQRWLAGE